jgi:MFS family permease
VIVSDFEIRVLPLNVMSPSAASPILQARMWTRQELAAWFALATALAHLGVRASAQWLYASRGERIDSSDIPDRLISWMLHGGFSGCVVGIAQGTVLYQYVRRLLRNAGVSEMVLRREARNTLWWPVVSAAGGLAAAAPTGLIVGVMTQGMQNWSPFVFDVLLALCGMLGAAITATLQWLILRHRAERAWTWILFTFCGWVAGAVLWSLASFGMATGGYGLPLQRYAGALLVGGIQGIVQGFCLSRLKQQWPPEVAEALRAAPEPPRHSDTDIWGRRLGFGVACFLTLNVLVPAFGHEDIIGRSAMVFGAFSAISLLALTGIVFVKLTLLRDRLDWRAVIVVILLLGVGACGNFLMGSSMNYRGCGVGISIR